MNVMRVFVTPELITTMLTTGYVLKGELTVKAGVPEGATLTAIGWDVPTRSWALDFSHPTFPQVWGGNTPDTLRISVERKAETLADALSE